MKKLILATVLLMVQSVFADVQRLTTITRQSDGVKSTLDIHKDNKSDATSFTFKIFEEDGSLDREINLRPNDLPEGKVVLEKMGIDVIIIKSGNFAEHNGGNMTIMYLSKFKLLGKNEYKDFNVVLDREGDNWVLSKEGRKFQELKAIDHSKGISRFEIVK